MSRHRRVEPDAEDDEPVYVPHLARLAEAQAKLERARQLPESRSRRARKRAEAGVEAASLAVQSAAEAAHDAGATWTEIGDLLGINRATPTPRATPLV
ncbi:hypothetical protein H7K45_13265 [Mycobacterium yunnanensis]|uniref:Uncharacterized protein n=1 Tax=Mycobacterium yunnanensis TaxID=368477 RepID=A0A9X2Z010_9MYCO|nr:hypothetical protein [Mycobacterium yunnanensis]MCV7421510.1 hypothetical protein [Mycobacterium yunnanensis]